MSTDPQTDLDKKLVRRAHTGGDRTAQALRKSVTFEMAEQRLAAGDWFWSEAEQDFVCVTEGPAGTSHRYHGQRFHHFSSATRRASTMRTIASVSRRQ
jgi:hypothetical protein